MWAGWSQQVMVAQSSDEPLYPGKRYEDWELDDPAGKPVEQVRAIRDEIDRRVQALLAELVPA
jgi:arsenate reductase